MAIPTLDFAHFVSGSESQRQELADALVQSFRNHGFAKLINHGFKDSLVAEIFEWSRKLFALPIQEKIAMANVPRDAPQRGWSRLGAETTARLRKENLEGRSGADLTDEKEHFDCGSPDDSEFPNAWPSEAALPGLKAFVETSYGTFQRESFRIIEAMELGLGLARGTIADKCARAASELRLNHYPAVPLSTLRNGKTRRGWPHADFGIITLLFQDATGGLELEDRANPSTFLPIAPTPAGAKSELVINISDTFQRWSNGVVSSGIHQVAPPPHMAAMDEGMVPERYSTIFFFKASREAMVGPLPEFVSEQQPALYDDITALQFQKTRTKILY